MQNTVFYSDNESSTRRTCRQDRRIYNVGHPPRCATQTRASPLHCWSHGLIPPLASSHRAYSVSCPIVGPFQRSEARRKLRSTTIPLPFRSILALALVRFHPPGAFCLQSVDTGPVRSGLLKYRNAVQPPPQKKTTAFDDRGPTGTLASRWKFFRSRCRQCLDIGCKGMG